MGRNLSAQVAQARRRAKRRGLPDTLTLSEWRDVLARSSGRCYYCGQECDDLTLEHLVPISEGGGSTADNIAAACFPCNRAAVAYKVITPPPYTQGQPVEVELTFRGAATIAPGTITLHTRPRPTTRVTFIHPRTKAQNTRIVH